MQILLVPAFFALALVSAVQTAYNYNESVSGRQSFVGFVVPAIVSSSAFTAGLCIIAKSFVQ